MDVNTIKIQCPNCGHGMEYWTKRNFINCVECGEKIAVEPCGDLIDLEEVEPEESEGDIEVISVYS